MENTQNELKNELQNRINQQLSRKGWTLKTLSDRSGVPYETLKKLANAKIDNPSLQSVIKVAQAFGCSLDSLFAVESRLISKLHSLSSRSLDFVEAIADLELSLMTQKEKTDQFLIPVVIPTGMMEDGMIYDSFYTEHLDASPYFSQFGTHLMCAMKITDNSFYPTYLEGDLLLLAKDRLPHYGTVCVLIHDNQLYIRRFVPGNPPRLFSLLDPNDSLLINNPTEFTFLGCVLTVVRPEN